MINATEFDKILYTVSNRISTDYITSVVGLDTEALNTGEPFMCCTSTGYDIDLHEFPQALFHPEFVDRHYVTYNLKYDSGALLYFLTEIERRVLWLSGEVNVYRKYYDMTTMYKVKYIPHKYLCIEHLNAWVKIWDIAQFFKSSLDKATKKYLPSGTQNEKMRIDTKTFTPEIVAARSDEIRKYCIQDAVITAALGNYFLEKLEALGIPAAGLYSSAYLAYDYFNKNSEIETVENIYKCYPELLKYSIEAYNGGKFEVSHRGHYTNGKLYDIVSAYPYEIKNLISLHRAKITFSKRYNLNAKYGFIRAEINLPRGVNSPVAVTRGAVEIFPVGRIFKTITKNEYDYLSEIGYTPKIISAWWIECYDNTKKPYAKVIDTLFKMKSSFKGVDEAFYLLSKLLMNGFYGKALQLVEHRLYAFQEAHKYGKYEEPLNETVTDKWYKAGKPFNPIYGAIITANTRIAVTRLQNIYGKKCLAVHTDSILLDGVEIPPKNLGGDLGELEFQCDGSGYIIACGQYSIGKKGAYKGFRPYHDAETEEIDNWEILLKKHRNAMAFDYPALHVESWYEHTAKGHKGKINLFDHISKRVNFNCDTKRIWLEDIKGRDLLENLEFGLQIELDEQTPESWGKHEKTATKTDGRGTSKPTQPYTQGLKMGAVKRRNTRGR